MRNFCDPIQLFGSTQVVRTTLSGAISNLLLQTCHPDFKKLIHVGTGNTKKKQSFQQGGILVSCLGQYPTVKFQQAKFPVNKIIRIIQIDIFMFRCCSGHITCQ